MVVRGCACQLSAHKTANIESMFGLRMMRLALGEKGGQVPCFARVEVTHPSVSEDRLASPNGFEDTLGTQPRLSQKGHFRDRRP